MPFAPVDHGTRVREYKQAVLDRPLGEAIPLLGFVSIGSLKKHLVKEINIFATELGSLRALG